MIKPALALAGLLGASLLAPLPAQAQDPAPPATVTTRQRAPGVPLAPRSGATARGAPDSPDRLRESRPGPNGERPPPQPDRDLPMPKPVPSIIAPTR